MEIKLTAVPCLACILTMLHSHITRSNANLSLALSLSLFPSHRHTWRFIFLFIFPVPLGSIPELPAESCAEIKASEDERVASGIVWLDPTNSGKAVEARCDVEKKGLESHCCL